MRLSYLLFITFLICAETFPSLHGQGLFHHAAEAHEGHGEDADGDEGDRDAAEGLRDVVHGEMLAEAGEDDHGEAVTQRGCKGIDHRLTEAQHMRGGAEGELLGNHIDGDTEDGAVGGDQRKEDTQGLIEGRAHFLQHYLDHLDEGGDHEDECNRLQEGQVDAEDASVLAYSSIPET